MLWLKFYSNNRDLLGVYMIDPKFKLANRAAFTLIELATALVGISLFTTYSADAAFSLVELCIVLVVLTLLGGILLGKMAQDTRSSKATNVQAQLDKIDRAIQNFVKQNNRLPRPADGSKAMGTDANFGVEVSDPSLATYNDGADTIGGVVPVRTLASYGLVDSDILDQWNNELGYFVSKRATKTNTR